jgi:hypothetical protein
MVKLKKHSTGDWDYSSTNWELNSVKYVSAPSSLAVLEDADVFLDVLVKVTTVPIANVKEGRIVTSFLYGDIDVKHKVRVVFRYQDADNYYYVKFDGGSNAVLVRRKAGVETSLKTYDFTPTYALWNKVRVTWWNDYVGLVVRVEAYEDTSWVEKGDGYDSENNWETIGGRVGFRMARESYYGFKVYIDDSEIYGIS